MPSSASERGKGPLSTSPKDRYRSDIDGLRAVAVLSVVGFHAFPTVVRGGFVGVDVFFVISGFLISGIIFPDMERGHFNFIDFYARRIRRIFPSLIVVLLFALAFGWLFLLTDEFRQLGKNIAGSGAFANNFILWGDSGYFDSAATQKPLLHLWSLGIEEQFYLSYPLLAWWIWRRSFALAALLTLCIASLVLNAILIGGYQSATFYSPLTRAWELLIGCLLAYASTRTRPSNLSPMSLAIYAGLENWISVSQARLRDSTAGVGVLLISGALVLLNSGAAYPGLWALLPTLGACCVIAAGSNAWINHRILSHPSLVFIGLISYPLYLWHWVVLSFANIITSGNATVLLRVCLVFVSVLLAWVTYRLIERPVRTGAGMTPKTVGLSLGMATMTLAGLGVYLTQGVPSRFSQDYLMRIQDVTNWGPGPDDQTNCPSGLRATSLRTGYCRGSSARGATVVVWGDSHAERLFEGVAKLNDTRSWLLLGEASCPPVVGIKVLYDGSNCEAVNGDVLKFIDGNAAIDLVVMIFANYIGDDYAADAVAHPIKLDITVPGIPSLGKTDSFAFGLGAAVASLQSSGKRVVIIIDNPELPFFPKQCLSRPFVTPEVCLISRADVERRQHDSRAVIDSVLKQHPGVMLFDPLGLFCNEETCSPIRNGVMLYFDSHHLSQRGGAEVASRFLNVLPRFEKMVPTNSFNCASANSTSSYSAVCGVP
jgi:peptidoglycan/LPS O-acetylase OafA/YrhL